MFHRLGLTLTCVIALTGAVTTSASADDLREVHDQWHGNDWHPWYGHTWRPYWRPYVYSTPYSYGFRYQDDEEVCHIERRKVRIVDERGRLGWIWKRVQVCD